MMINHGKKSKGQSTAEYAIVIGFVVAAIIAMQIYVRRGLQGKVKTVTDRVGDGLLDGGIKNVVGQYEPYYASSNYNVVQTRDAREQVSEGYIVKREDVKEETKRLKGGISTQGTDLSADSAWRTGNAGN